MSSISSLYIIVSRSPFIHFFKCVSRVFRMDVVYNLSNTFELS
eukprot:UN09996